MAFAALLVWLGANAWPLRPGHIDRQVSIPFHVTDVVGLLAPLALTRGWRWARNILYFWGFGLTTQAFVTPALSHGPATVSFWCFWLGHVAILAAAVYDVARGYRPTWRDYGLAVGMAVVYFVLALSLDVALGVNYGFVGPSNPEQPSLIDVLGPWPRRLLLIVPLACVVMALPMLPWALASRLARRHPQRTDQAPSTHR